MKLARIVLILALPTLAQATFTLGSDGPGGFSYWHEDHWDVNGIHVDPPQSVPEASPTMVLTLAAAALLQKRRRK
jgi:hypothetical protein